MAVTINLTDLADLQNEPTAVAAINANNAVLEGIASDVFSRSGTSPNTINCDIDMNSRQIYNLPEPSSLHSPARLIDVVSNPTLSTPGTGTSGHVVGYLDTNNTHSGNNTFSGTVAHTAAITGTSGVFSGNFSANNVTAATTLFGTNLSISGAVVVPANSITLNRLELLPGLAIVGNAVAANASPTVLSGTQVTTLLDTFTSSLKGLAPASGGGTANFLRADGTWAIPGTKVLLNTLTASSSATLDDTTSLTSTYSMYEIEGIDLIPATNGAAACIQVHSGGTYQASGYINSAYGYNSISGVLAATGTTTSNIVLNYDQVTDTSHNTSNSGPGMNFFLKVSSPSSSKKTILFGRSTNVTALGTSVWNMEVAGYWNTAAVIDGIRFVFNTGNITSGKIKIYGIV